MRKSKKIKGMVNNIDLIKKLGVKKDKTGNIFGSLSFHLTKKK